MGFVIQDNFNKPKNISELSNDPLIIHKRSQDSNNQDIIIFVHGFGGNRYVTWGNFPIYLYEDLIKVDIGVYYYRTFWRRFNFTASVDLDDEAIVLADIIRDINYNNVVLIGHSMGGLLCKAAIKELINRDDEITLNKLSSLFLIASPQAGSIRVPRIISWFSRDLQVLKVHSRLQQEIAETFNNRVSVDKINGESNKYIIPIWAVLSVEDFWVDKLSAGLNLQSARKKNVHGSHRRVVKPKTKDDDTYKWILIHIKDSLGFPPSLQEVNIPKSYSYPVYKDIIKRDTYLEIVYKNIIKSPIVLVEGVVGSWKSHVVSNFIQKYGKFIYRNYVWYNAHKHNEIHQLFEELINLKFNFAGPSNHSTTKNLIRFLNDNNLLLVIDDFHLANIDSYLPLIRFSYNNTGPARIILISDLNISKDYYNVTTVNIEGYSDDEARQLLASHNLVLNDNQFRKLKLRTSLLPFAVDLFINLCTGYLYSPDTLLEGNLPPDDHIKAWVSRILKSLSEKEKYALQFLSLNDGSFDTSLIRWCVDRHLKDIDGQYLLSTISKPFFIKQNPNNKYEVIDFLVQYFKQDIDITAKKLIYESLGDYYYNLYNAKLADPKAMNVNELINISKACEFYQQCNLFEKSSFIINRISLALKLAGHHLLLLKLCNNEMEHNKKRNSWIDLNYAQTCLALGRVKDSFKILLQLVDPILYMDERNVNKKINFIRIFCEALIYLKQYQLALDILSNAYNLLPIHQAKWNVCSQAKSVISYLYLLNGEIEESKELNLHLIDECTTGNHPHGVAIAKTRMGIAYIKENNFIEAVTYLSEAATIFTSYDRRGFSWANMYLAKANYELGNNVEADTNLGMALDIQIEHNFVGDNYYEILCYFEQKASDPDIIDKISQEKARLIYLEEQRNIEPKEIVPSEVLAICNSFFMDDKITNPKPLAIAKTGARIGSPIIKSFVNAASRNPINIINKLFTEFEPSQIFSRPLFNKFISEACKRKPHLIHNYILPNISLIKKKSDSIKLHYARILEYNKIVSNALELLESVKRKEGYKYNNIMANCLFHSDFIESMKYNNKALEETSNPKNKAKIYTNMANLIYHYHVNERYLEAIEYCERAIEYRLSERFYYPIELMLRLKVQITGKANLKDMVSDIKSKYSFEGIDWTNLMHEVRDREKRNILQSLLIIN